MPGKISKFSKRSTTSYINNKKGAEFERRLEQGVLATGGYPIRIADGARRVGMPGPPYHRYIPVRQPFDYIVSYGKDLIFLDCKCTSYNTVTYSKVFTDPRKNPGVAAMKKTSSIQHQFNSLEILNESAVCGFLYFFDQLNMVVFFSVDTFKSLKPKTSLKPDDGIYLGMISDFDLRILFKKTDNNI